MKCVILAGGLGSRLSEETAIKPKPMVEIGGKPILWHIMKLYELNGITDFIICLGYKGYVIKEYFLNYSIHNSDFTINTENSEIILHKKYSQPWNITLVDTGEHSMTGGRIARIKKYVQDEQSFCLTYGDGLSNIDINASIQFHNKSNSFVTMSAVYPPARFGRVVLEENKVVEFTEKPVEESGRINGGFFIVNKDAIDYISNDQTIWESDVLTNLSKEGKLSAWIHNGFWQAMDTLRDKNYLEKLFAEQKTYWLKK